MKGIEKAVVDRCREELAALLAPAGEDAVETVVSDIFAEAGSAPMDEALPHLLDAGLGFSTLISALLRCQLVHLGLLASSAGDDAGPELIGKLAMFFQHYADIQARWIQLAERHYQERIADLGSRLDRERDLFLLERTRNGWIQSRQITLFNYYFEMQVAAIAKVTEVDERSVVIRRSPKLERVFAAGDRGRLASAISADPAKCVVVHLERADDDVVVLRILRVADDPEGQRSGIRVRRSGRCKMEIGMPGGARVEARVIDFSEQGLGLKLAAGASISVGMEVRCKGEVRAEGHSARIACQGVVRWVRMLDGAVRAGVQVTPSPSERKALQDLLRAHEQAVIHKLRQIEPPQALL